MKKLKFIGMGIAGLFLVSSCSVQQFGVNTEVKPFENGGRVWGERTEKCGEDAWALETRKSGDLHLLGFNVKSSDTKQMVADLGAERYTIETKSNLVFLFLSGGMVDYKIVKVIKRDM